jgi:hypothetical protein
MSRPFFGVLMPGKRRDLWIVVLTAAVCAVAVVGAWVVFVAPNGSTSTPGGCYGCGTSLAVNKPIESANAANHWYNFTVESAGGGMVLNNLEFQVVAAVGSNVGPNATWTLDLVDLSGNAVGSYPFSGGTWTTGGTTLLTSGGAFDLDTGSMNLGSQGDALNLLGTDGFQGSISVNIP